MVTDIDFYFDPDTWVIPETVEVSGIKIKNSGLKIVFDPLNPEAIRFSGSDYHECWSCLGIILKNGSILHISIETQNLFKVTQYSGIVMEGFLKGTYKLSRMKNKINNVYRLIPEDSRENLWKSEISNIYQDSKKFTSKMIPGHLYISKSKALYICLKEKLLDYSSDFPLKLELEEKPKEQKYLLEITPDIKDRIDRISPKNFQELMEKVHNPFPYSDRFYSKGFLGKDLGKVVDKEDILDYFITPDHIHMTPKELLLSDELWKTNTLVRKELISRIIERGFVANQVLRDELGI